MSIYLASSKDPWKFGASVGREAEKKLIETHSDPLSWRVLQKCVWGAIVITTSSSGSAFQLRAHLWRPDMVQ